MFATEMFQNSLVKSNRLLSREPGIDLFTYLFIVYLIPDEQMAPVLI